MYTVLVSGQPFAGYLSVRILSNHIGYSFVPW